MTDMRATERPMVRCDYQWQAPYLLPPPSSKVTHVPQICSLSAGHDGPHRSLSNVIHTSEGRKP